MTAAVILLYRPNPKLIIPTKKGMSHCMGADIPGVKKTGSGFRFVLD